MTTYTRGYEKHNITAHNRDLPTTDNVYVDVRVNNTTDERRINTRFQETRLSQVVDNPSNYFLTLTRWKVPGFELPLLIFPVQTNHNDPTISQYSVTLESSTDIQQVFLYWISYALPSETITEDIINGNTPSEYYFLYDYQHMVDLVNTALQTAFDALLGKPIDSIAPYLIYDAEVKLFSLVAQEVQYSVDADPVVNPMPPPAFLRPTFDAGIKVFMNYKLYSLFNGLPANYRIENSSDASLGRDVQILIKNNHDNVLPDDLLEMQQSFYSLSFWSPVKQIIFITELIPTNSEFTAVSNDSFRKILTDFEPVAETQTDVRTLYQYLPQAQYRLIDLIGTKPLYNINLLVKWLDIEGNEYNVKIPQFQQFSAKLLFVKRNMYKTNNLIYDN